jgi:hypothetical protein
VCIPREETIAVEFEFWRRFGFLEQCSTMVVPLDRYQLLVEWMVDNKIEFSSSLRVKESPLGGTGVYALRNIEPDSVLLRVPKEHVLSPVTCGIANLLEEHELDGMLGLTLAYMFERCQGVESPWYAFLQTIDRVEDATLPRFWSQDEQKWLTGSEIEFMGGLNVAEVVETYQTKVAPFIGKFKDMFSSFPEYSSYEGYASALLETCSRAFEVDHFRGLSLVPGACLFNHSDNEHVHFESQAEVCDMCGDAEYCEHLAFQEVELAKLSAGSDSDSDFEDIEMEEDDDDEREQQDDTSMPDLVDGALIDEIVEEAEGDDEEKDSCDIVTIRPVAAGEEIFNSYGDYGNGVLLSRYGFAIWDNGHETVGLGPEILKYAKINELKSRLSWWGNHFYRCLFGIAPEDYGDLDDDMEDVPPPPDSLTWRDTLEIESSGMPTPGLILAVNLLSLSPKKFTLLQAQARKGKFNLLAAHLEGKKVLQWLINKRLSRYVDGGLSSKEYKKLLTTELRSHQKLAAVVIGTEKLVLERCLKGI